MVVRVLWPDEVIDLVLKWRSELFTRIVAVAEAEARRRHNAADGRTVSVTADDLQVGISAEIAALESLEAPCPDTTP